MALVVIPLLVSAAAIGVKRLHDSNRPGWRLIALYAVPAALLGIPGHYDASDTTMGFAVILALPFMIWAIVVLGCKRGTDGPNQYGADPRPPR